MWNEIGELTKAKNVWELKDWHDTDLTTIMSVYFVPNWFCCREGAYVYTNANLEHGGIHFSIQRNEDDAHRASTIDWSIDVYTLPSPPARSLPFTSTQTRGGKTKVPARDKANKTRGSKSKVPVGEKARLAVEKSRSPEKRPCVTRPEAKPRWSKPCHAWCACIWLHRLGFWLSIAANDGSCTLRKFYRMADAVCAATSVKPN